MSEPEIDQTELARVIRKIKHCLALATSSNEHEAAAALRQAQKLMHKYRVTETDIHLSDVKQADGSKVCSKRPAWDKHLAGMVARVFNCKTLTYAVWNQQGKRQTGREEHAVFIGVSPAPEIAKYAYDAIYVQVELARKNYVADIKRGVVGIGAYSPTTRGNDFAEAWVSQIEKKLQALVPQEDVQEAAGDEKALIAVQSQESTLIEAYLDKATGGEGVHTQRRRKPRAKNISDLVNGIKAGRNAQLSPGVGAAGQEQVSIGFSHGQS
jgi:hypothetical protein